MALALTPCSSPASVGGSSEHTLQYRVFCLQDILECRQHVSHQASHRREHDNQQHHGHHASGRIISGQQSATVMCSILARQIYESSTCSTVCIVRSHEGSSVCCSMRIGCKCRCCPALAAARAVFCGASAFIAYSILHNCSDTSVPMPAPGRRHQRHGRLRG